MTAAIQRLVDDPFYEHFDVICCVNALNIDHLEAFTDHLAALGVPRVRFTPVFSRGRADAASGLMLSGEQLRRMLAFVAAQRATRRNIVVTLSEEGYWAELGMPDTRRVPLLRVGRRHRLDPPRRQRDRLPQRVAPIPRRQRA